MFVSFSLHPPETGMVSYRAEDVCGVSIYRIVANVVPTLGHLPLPRHEIKLSVDVCGELKEHLIGVHETHADAYKCHNKVIAMIEDALTKGKEMNVNVKATPNRS